MAFDWTKETLCRLEDLWRDGHATAAIGHELGVSKNAVIGKVHRLGLPARPSPIRGAVPLQSVPKPTKPRVRARKPKEVVCSTTTQTPAPPPAQLPATPPPRPITPAPPVEPVHPSLSLHSTWGPAEPRNCCWPIGEPGRIGFRFCGAPADASRPYCAEHCAVAYARPRASSDASSTEAHNPG